MSLQVPVNDRFVKVSPSAGTTVIDTDYPVIAAADVEVWRQRAAVVSKLTLSTDYTMSLLGNQLGARVTLSAASLAGDVYVVTGARSTSRITSFIEGQFRSGDINDELTSVLILLQELRSLALRAVRFPPMSGDLSSEIPAGSAAGLLALSGSGALEVRSSTGSTFHVTTTTPGAGLGIDNDVALVVNAADAAHGKVFAKTGGAWVDKGSIRGPAGVGDVAGPASSTDNAFARFDLATGKVLQNGLVGADDSGNMFGVKYTEIDEIAAPAAPAAGKRRLYARAGQLYSIGSTGGEMALGGGGGGVGQNLIINGDFQINQRTFAGGALSAGSFGHSRWKAAAAGANYTISGFVVTLASGEIEQPIEPACFGYTSLASLAVTISVEAPSDDCTVTLGSQSGTISGGVGRRSVTLTLGAGDTGNLAFKIKRAAAGSVSFGRIKAEVGSAATAWDARSTVDEYLLCCRYFYRWGYDEADTGTGFRMFGYGGAGVFEGQTVRHPVEMRAKPTMLRSGVWTTTNITGTPSISDITKQSFSFSFQVTSTLSFDIQTNSTDDYIQADAEL
jgi:hypothetical protein